MSQFQQPGGLAIEIRDQDVIDRLHKLVHYDWKDSRPIDLSDGGFVADMAERWESLHSVSNRSNNDIS